MDRLWTWFPTRRQGSYSPAEPETPNMNEAKEKETGKKKWKNIFSRDRKPKDAGKLLKEEALEDKVPQKKEKKKWKDIFSRNRKPKDAGKLLKEALEPEGDEGLELHSSLEDISPGVQELHADTEAGAMKNTSLDETRGDTEMLLPVEELEAEAGALKNISLDEPRDVSLDEPRDVSLDEPRGDTEMLLPVEELEAETEALTNTSLDETRDISLDKTRGNAEMLLPVGELEAEPEVLNNTSLDETKDNAEMLLPVSELEAEPEVLNNTSLDETKDIAEMLLPVRELEAEAEAPKDLIKTSLVESEETELQNRGDTEADLFSNGDDGGITGEHGRGKKIRRGTRGRGRKINYKKKDNNGSEIINKVKVEAEAEAEAEVLTNTSLDETRDNAEMLLPVSELEAEPEALKDLIKTSLVESEETELQNRGDTEADLFSNGDDGGITGEHGRRKKIRRGTRGRGRKINYKKKDNNGSEIINEVNAEAEAEAEVAEVKNIHLDEKDSSADLLNPDQPLGEEKKQWVGRGDPEDGMKQKKKIRRGTRGCGRKIIYKKDASKAEESAAGFNHQNSDYVCTKKTNKVQQ